MKNVSESVTPKRRPKTIVLTRAKAFVIGAQAVVLCRQRATLPTLSYITTWLLTNHVDIDGYANSGFAIHIWNMTMPVLGAYRKVLSTYLLVISIQVWQEPNNPDPSRFRSAIRRGFRTRQTSHHHALLSPPPHGPHVEIYPLGACRLHRYNQHCSRVGNHPCLPSGPGRVEWRSIEDECLQSST